MNHTEGQECRELSRCCKGQHREQQLRRTWKRRLTSIKEMGKALGSSLPGFWTRSGHLKNQKLFLLLKLRIMNPDKEVGGNDTKE